MYCKKCGNELADNARFCGVCGTPVTQQLETNVVPNKPKKSKLKYIIIGIIVICLSVIGTIAGFKVKNYTDVKNELKKYDVVGTVIPVKDSVCVMSEKEVYEEIKARGFDVEAEDVIYYFDMDGNNYGEEYDDDGNFVWNVEKTIDPSSDEKHPGYTAKYGIGDELIFLEFDAGDLYCHLDGYEQKFERIIHESKEQNIITQQQIYDIDSMLVSEGVMPIPMIYEKDTFLGYAYNDEVFDYPNSYIVYPSSYYMAYYVDEINAESIKDITFDYIYGEVIEKYGLLTS